MRLVTEVVDREWTPLGELVLERYVAPDGTVGYGISIDGNFLMATHGCASEKVLASLAHRRLLEGRGWPFREGLSCLVGGLGAGHTLRAALDLPAMVRVVVVEIGAKVVEWNRRFFAQANGHAIDDPRVEVVIEDVHETLPRFRGTFDLILLDVDNGPGWLAAPGNARLYRPDGLRRAREALRPGGVLGVWSPQPNPVFREALGQVFPEVHEVVTSTESRAVGEIPDVIYLGCPEDPIGNRRGR